MKANLTLATKPKRENRANEMSRNIEKNRKKIDIK